MTPIPRGATLLITSGEYSDFDCAGAFIAKTDLNPDELRAEYLSSHSDQTADYHFREKEFIGWLVSRDLVAQVDTFTWHLGNYGNANEMSAALTSEWVDPY